MPDPTPVDPAPQDPKPADPNAEPSKAGDPPPDPPKTDPPDDVDLGDGGKKALQAEREARKAAEKARTGAEAKVKEFEDAKLTEQQRLEKERDEARETAATSGRQAALYKAAIDHGLGAEDLELLDGVPADQIDGRAKRLADRLAAGKAPGTPKPDPSQGARGSGADLDEQIAAAESKGDIRESIRLKQQKAAAAASTS